MKTLRKIFKCTLYFLLVPASYIVVSLTLSAITIERNKSDEVPDKTIYLASNGVHLDIVLPKEGIESKLLSHLRHKPNENYLAFGWGDKEFYLNTPTWNDLTLNTAFKAVFFKGSALIHVTRYQNKQSHWIKIEITESELRKLNNYLYETFELNNNEEKILLKRQGYTTRDDFYKAKGSFSFYKTCNSWVNTGFKSSGMKSCLWTPFDFGLMNKYK
ncbi:hypothetical protein MATR_29940 [Marivirga tractuosa]|uniref:DUF2459 domain-containing protein n=1 Tax=Marivirga tractuosa (strain ATCC 23168 / DSM 4126 / NBRC 15989 / NCIMB 1408 / VKM B-1430 / H-43) TaxID=643867 RepID=E4TV92_MARTH|nr:DUF2459 domain-containing protein [Marivirga tractuosa]ADR23157.1 Conserved hypothetical protein CHP02117 [Marivirga tractuosa DSM 4126]BDD16169.1 hypothetical protein MATR_29940 [Marivirga tractuosa]